MSARAVHQQNRSMLAVARECRERAEAMTGTQLDDWYASHVGIRLTSAGYLRPEALTYLVASRMFNDAVNAPSTPIDNLLKTAILTGRTL